MATSKEGVLVLGWITCEGESGGVLITMAGGLAGGALLAMGVMQRPAGSSVDAGGGGGGDGGGGEGGGGGGGDGDGGGGCWVVHDE